MDLRGIVRAALLIAAAVAGALWLSGCSKKQALESMSTTPDTLAAAVDTQAATLDTLSRDTLTPFAASDTPFETSNAPPAKVIGNTLIDGRDGKRYRIVKIAHQTWMAANLNHWTGNSWCYDNNESNCDKYGALYDWDLATKVCPGGWHLPTRREWCVLATAAGGAVAGTRLKSKNGWKREPRECYPDRQGELHCYRPKLICGTDDFGFSALPGGRRYFADGSFNYAGYRASWWTATGHNGYAASYSAHYHKNKTENGGGADMGFGYSVRCVMNDSGGLGGAPIYTVIVSGAGAGASGGGCYIPGAVVRISAGTAPNGQRFKKWTVEEGGAAIADKNSAATAFTMPANNVTVAAVFQNRKARGKAKMSGDTLIDADDGQRYLTTVIGGKRWMAKNLNFVVGNSWRYDACCADERDYGEKYGRLYDWSTAMTACPDGWHLPTRREWDSLASAVGGNGVHDKSIEDEIDWFGVGRKLKARDGWDEFNGQSGGGTDDYGFSALPGGLRRSDDVFLFAGINGIWWTSSPENSDGYVYERLISYEGDYGDVMRESTEIKEEGLSVRCVQDGD